MKREFTPEEQEALEKMDPETRALVEKFGFAAFEGYDCRDNERSPEEQAYWESTTPDHVKQAIATRKAKQAQQ